MRKLFGMLVIVAALFAVPRAEVEAQTDHLGSSMTAACIGVGGACDTVEFLLSVAGDQMVSFVDVMADESSVWRFGSLIRVFNSAGTDVTGNWAISSLATGLHLYAASFFLPGSEPLRLQAGMTGVGTPGQFDGSVTYFASGGDASLGGSPNWIADGTVTTVTPEPSTIFLLGTGLVGVAVVARRRRNEDGTALGDD